MLAVALADGLVKFHHIPPADGFIGRVTQAAKYRAHCRSYYWIVFGFRWCCRYPQYSS